MVFLQTLMFSSFFRVFQQPQGFLGILEGFSAALELFRQ